MAGTKEEWDDLHVKQKDKNEESLENVREGWIGLNDHFVTDNEDQPVGVIVPPKKDVVNEPDHYVDVPEIYEHHRVMDAIGANYHFANAMKYLFRAGKKSSKGMSIEDKEIQDVRKSIRYLEMWIELRQEAVTKESFYAK